jgi:hypothetical protein
MRRLATEQFGDPYWDRALVAFLDLGTGDHVCVDVSGAYGPDGCVVAFAHERPAAREIHYDSITEWLECFVDGLYVDHGPEGLFARGLLETGSARERWAHDSARTNDRYPWSRAIRLRDADRP